MYSFCKISLDLQMLSHATKYAINAVLYLAAYASEEKKMGAKEVSIATNIPLPFLSKLLQTLAKKNIITSTKGPKGGFFLSNEHKQLPLIIIVDKLEGLHKFDECVLGLRACNSLNPCSIHFSMKPYKDKLLAEMSNNSIETFAEKVKEGTVFLTFVCFR